MGCKQPDGEPTLFEDDDRRVIRVITFASSGPKTVQEGDNRGNDHV
jgi:hypothetical protein